VYKIIIPCGRCMQGFEVEIKPCFGLEVIKHVKCPVCTQTHTLTISVTVQVEEESIIARG